MRSLLVLVLAFLLAAFAAAPSTSAGQVPEVCSDVAGECGGTVCVTWGAIPWSGACVQSIGDVCEWFAACQPCTCPPIQSEPLPA